MPTYRINKSLIIIGWIFSADHQNIYSLFIHSIFFFGCIVSATESLDVTFNISENVPSQTRVGILTEVIEKFRYKAGVHFHLQQIEYQSEKPLFQINKYSGVITTAGEINREEICPKVSGTNLPCSISLVVSVVEYLINIKINIIDVNDNSPKFQLSKKVMQIPENEEIDFTIELDQATDLDSLQFGIDNYKLIPEEDSSFAVAHSTNNLKLKLIKRLDFEKVENYNLILEVCDTGNLCSKQTIIIEVIDVNDIAPKFVHRNYSVVVNETIKIGTQILKVHAFDNEKGDFGKIIYRLGDSNEFGSKFIRIDSKTGDIYLMKLLLGMDKILVTIEAQDCGSVPKFAWTKLLIHIIDVNDNKPEIRFIPSQNVSSKYISDDSYQIDIFENQPVFITLAIVRVDDKDRGVNGKVVCKLESIRSVKVKEVILQPIKGRFKFYRLITNVSYDKENENHISSYVLNCADNGSPSLSTTIVININILDCNEYPPYFDSQFYSATTIEEITSNNVVKFALADADATSINEFQINGTYGHWFKIHKIDKRNGKLILLQPIDREKIDRIDLLIVIINIGLDNKNFTSSSSVLITIIDRNDNPPMLFGRSNFEVVENSLIDSSLGKITIRDLDQNKNAQFSISNIKSFCVNRNNEEINTDFRINKIGEIRSNVILDYEKIQNCIILITAKDEGLPSLTSTLTVSLQILDENDNFPQWIFPSVTDNLLNISISSTGVGSKLTRIRAVDLDKGGNENVTYTLHSQLGLFDLDRFSGQLISISQLKPGKYVLQISAQDQGLPSKTNYSNLTIFVLTSNSDNSKFSSHILLILGLIPTCALVILICAVIPIVFIVKWQKRRQHHRIPLSIETQLYHCPEVNHISRSDYQNEIDSQKNNLIVKSKTKNTLNIEEIDTNKNYVSMPPDLQNICDKITSKINQSEYQSSIKPSMSNANPANDIDVCSADSGQGASVEDVAGNYFKGHYDPLKYPYPLPGYHWCPILPEDKQVDCHCSSNVDQQYTIQINLNAGKLEESSNNLSKPDNKNQYSPAPGMELNNICWCQQCTKYPNIPTDCVGVSNVNPICQVHSNIFPIIFSHSHQTSTVDNPSPEINCPDLYSKSIKKEIKTIFNTQV